MEKITNIKALDYVLEHCELPQDYADKLSVMRENFQKRATYKRVTPTQKENEVLKAQICDAMVVGTQYSASDIAKMMNLESNQKASALLRQLVAAESVVRVEEKGHAKFMLKED